jgi:hypothetical protein
MELTTHLMRHHAYNKDILLMPSKALRECDIVEKI